MHLADLSSPAVDALPRNTPVVFPIGALEQHSRHLPVFTDSAVAGELARRASEALGDQVLFAPVMWLGNSAHHLDFAGSMSASPRVYVDMLRDMAECMLRHGFCRIVFLNAHGGNSVPGQQALYELRQKYRERNDLLLLLANFWMLGSNPRESIPALTQPAIQHACQWETSIMLALQPQNVGDATQLEPVDYGNPFQPAIRSWVTQDVTANGHIGDPRSGTKEIGEALLDIYANDVVSLLRRVVAWDGKSWSG